MLESEVFWTSVVLFMHICNEYKVKSFLFISMQIGASPPQLSLNVRQMHTTYQIHCTLKIESVYLVPNTLYLKNGVCIFCCSILSWS